MKLTLFKLVTLLLIFCFTQPVSYAQNLPMLGDTNREDLSPVAERKLGEKIMLGIRNDKDYIDDDIVSEYLNDFGSRLLEAHKEARGETDTDFYFFVVRDTKINAFALPGGFIGVHSELVLTAENESQLASVLAHEIGHVAQRHIARMLGNQKQDMLIPIASLILAALTMNSSPDAAMALAVGGQGFAVQRQLNFSQNAEREADRVGLQILRDGGFDPSDMVAFFERMQNSSRAYSDNFPAFLRTHPMTTERIADIQLRIRSEPFKKHVDNPDYQLFRARVHVLQDESTQGLLNSTAYFKDQLAHSAALKQSNSAAAYSLAFSAFKQSNFKQAQAYLDKARNKVTSNGVKNEESKAEIDSLFFTSLELDILLASGKNAEALKQAELALQKFPASHGIGRQYVDALIANNQGEKAVNYLRDQTLLYRKDFSLQEQLAKTYAFLGKDALQHLALAQSYALSGAISPALDQLNIARHSSDATFYDLAIIDARERDLKERYKDDLQEELESRKKQSEKFEVIQY